MDSFKVYLPSNASADIFPNNTPSNYQTQLTDPIQLQGEWEAGLESIFYSSKIGDEKENVNLNLSVKAERKVYVTSEYPHSYRVTKDWKWPPQFFNLYPGSHVTKPIDQQGVVRCLNSINRKILTPEDKSNVFLFKVRGKRIVYSGATNGIVLDMPVKMTRYLGFGWKHILSGRTSLFGGAERRIPEKLIRNYYRIKFVDTNVLRKITRVVIKVSGRISPKSSVLLEYVWTEKIFKPYNIGIKFSKSGKLILENYNEDRIVRLSPDFSKSFHMAEAVFPRHTEWALGKFDKDQLYENDFWYVDIYSTDIDHFYKTEHYNISYGFTPRRFDNVTSVILTINRLTLEKLKQTVASLYNDDFHKCELSLFENHTKLNIGKWISLTISNNLAFLLGFDQDIFESGNYLSKRLTATLEQREQHLFVLTDFIQSTSYGDKKVDVLQEFVHEGDTEEKRIIEKRFHPISYSPIKRSYIENIQIQLVNEIFKPIFIRNSKTIVILHLRKRK